MISGKLLFLHKRNTWALEKPENGSVNTVAERSGDEKTESAEKAAVQADGTEAETAEEKRPASTVYRAFGYYAGFEFVDLPDRQQTLACMWSKVNERMRAKDFLDLDVFLHPMYLFSAETQGDEADTRASADKGISGDLRDSGYLGNPDCPVYPIRLLTFLKLEESSCGEKTSDRLKSVARELAGLLKDRGNASLYYTMNCFDGMLQIDLKDLGKLSDIFDLLFSREDKNGTRVIYYAYSICGYREEWLEDEETLGSSAWTRGKAYRRRFFSGPGLNVVVSGIIKNYEKTLRWIDNLKKYGECTSLSFELGSNDICVYFSGLKEGQLRRLMGRGKKGNAGLLNMENPLLQDGLSRMTVRLTPALHQGNRSGEMGMFHPTVTAPLFSQILSKKLINMERRIKKKYMDGARQIRMPENLPMVLRALYSLMAAVKQAEKNQGTRELFLSVCNPVYVLLEKLDFIFLNYLEKPNGQDGDESMKEEEVAEEVFRVICSIDDILRRATHAHRHYFEAPDMHLKLFDIPAKWLAGYVGYIYTIVDILRNLDQPVQDAQYGFILSPELCTKMSLEEWLTMDGSREKGGKHRLVAVSAPERDLFQPEKMLSALVHEVAHWVGNQWRKREERDRYMVHGIFLWAGAMSKKMLEEAKEATRKDAPEEMEIWDDEWNQCMARMERKWRQMEQDVIREVQKKKICSASAGVVWNMDFMEKHLMRLVDQEIKRMVEEGDAPWYMAPAKASDGLKYQIKRIVKQTEAEMFNKISKQIQEMVELLVHVLQEGAADIAMICILDLKAGQYLRRAHGMLRRGKIIENGVKWGPDAARAAMVCAAAYPQFLEEDSNDGGKAYKSKDSEEDVESWNRVQNILERTSVCYFKEPVTEYFKSCICSFEGLEMTEVTGAAARTGEEKKTQRKTLKPEVQELVKTAREWYRCASKMDHTGEEGNDEDFIQNFQEKLEELIHCIPIFPKDDRKKKGGAD